jgi:DNA ligase-1
MKFEYKGCQLAKHWTGWVDELDYVLVEPKVDGYRLNATVELDGSITFRCRDEESPQWIEHLGHVAVEVSDLGLEPGTMLDGEVMAKDWNETSKLLRRFRENMDEDDLERIRQEVKFHVFDLVDLRNIREIPPKGRQRKPRLVYDRSQHERTADVEELLLGINERSTLRLLPSVMCASAEQVDATYARFAQEYEGAIVKVPHAPYYFSREDAWLKIKPTSTVEIVLTGAVEGEGKHKGRLGALEGKTLQGADVRVGTGFSDAERERLWAMRDRLAGLRAEISHQAGTVATARHPVYHRLRDLG